MGDSDDVDDEHFICHIGSRRLTRLRSRKMKNKNENVNKKRVGTFTLLF